VRDIAQVARVSLNDVREAVAGYRQADLQTEIRARGLHCARPASDFWSRTRWGRSSEQDGVLACACVRRYQRRPSQRARKCEVRLSRSNGSSWLDVSDDGHGALEGGTGGMRERVELAGGTMEVASDRRRPPIHVTIPGRA
jgi:signal transduction histidine kinase